MTFANINARTVSTICAIMIAIYALAFFGKSIGPEGMVLDTNSRPRLVDHLSLWTAGRLAAEGNAAGAYDRREHAGAMAEAMGYQPTSPLPFSYPPSLMLVLTPLSQQSFPVSFVLFGLLSLVPFAWVSIRIVGRPDAALWTLAMVPPFWNFCVGQTGALAAALLGAGLLLLPSRPAMAGVMLGLLTFKPHLGLLVPIALLAAGEFRAIASAVLTTVALFLASTAMFGMEPWLAFAASLPTFGAFALADTNLTAYKLQSIFGVLRALGVGSNVALAMQAMLALALTALTWQLWRRPVPHALKSAILMTSATLATPYAFHYDLTLLTLAQAFWLRHAIERGITTNDVMAILLMNALIMLFPQLDFPTGFFAAATLLGILLHRVHAENAGSMPWPRRRASPQPAIA